MEDHNWTLPANAEITIGETVEVARIVTRAMAATFKERGWENPPDVSPAIVYAVFECLRRRHRKPGGQP